MKWSKPYWGVSHSEKFGIGYYATINIISDTVVTLKRNVPPGTPKYDELSFGSEQEAKNQAENWLVSLRLYKSSENFQNGDIVMFNGDIGQVWRRKVSELDFSYARWSHRVAQFLLTDDEIRTTMKNQPSQLYRKVD